MSVGIEGICRAETKSRKLRLSYGMKCVVVRLSVAGGGVEEKREGCLLSPTSLPNPCSRRRQQRVPAARLDDVRWSSGRSVPRVDLGTLFSSHHSTLSPLKFNIFSTDGVQRIAAISRIISLLVRLRNSYSHHVEERCSTWRASLHIMAAAARFSSLQLMHVLNTYSLISSSTDES